jgi:formylglycine-generating enzyme required for sulfatase activity/alpha/beta superfamily hydrolase
MKQIQIFLLSAALIFTGTAFGQDTNSAADASAITVATSGHVPGTVFRDCPDCPEMVVIPAGNFTMGSSASEKSWASSHGANPESVSDESPQHHASLRSFALGKYDVTRGEYAAFVRETGYPAGDGCFESSMPKSNKKADGSWQNPGFSQTDRDPVTCVSWEDAQAYITWLNGKLHNASSTSTEGAYRLPSEAEWEYAARAGTTTRFWWGDDDSSTANYAWYKGNAGGKTHPVGSKPANPFGLYEMVGNVWQWTEDCYAESYANASTDGSANQAAKDCLRVDRGGSWMYPAWLLRSATRERNPADYRDAIMGFRLAKTLQGKESPTLINTPQAQKSERPPTARVVELKASDGTVLKASYFAAAKPGPGVLLLHQSNRTRKAWDDLAGQLAAAGINTLTLDIRGFGESGGKPDKRLTDARDIDTAFQYLVSQPGVKRDVIGVGGAGVLGVDRSVEVARQRSAQVKSLVLLSGETLQDGLQFLRRASQLPGLFVVADDDEYPPIVEAMELLYITSSNSGKKFVHYSAAQEAPWLWYEPFDVGRVPANGGHGTDMFKVHPELPGIIVDWFVTTLIKTPGHAPADTLASAAIINQIRTPGGVAQVTQQLMEARRRDPEAQLFPEITVSTIGQGHLRAGEPKLAVEVLKLVLLAYPESADAHETLAEAYLKDGQNDLARQHAEKALTLLDSHTAPASSWTDTEQYRGEIRRGAQDVLKQLNAAR